MNTCCNMLTSRNFRRVLLAALAGIGITHSLNAQTNATISANTLPEIIVYASDLTTDALSEFDFWKDSASPGGKLIGTRNTGDELDPPPENDPHVTFKVTVRRGVPYRCWIHMKVGAPMGKSQANKFWVQFTDAVNKLNKEILLPDTDSYLTAQGSTRQGWSWVGCNYEGRSPQESLVRFRVDGQVTVRLQAGMEGVGFDQFLLSPSRYLDSPPTEQTIKKAH